MLKTVLSRSGRRQRLSYWRAAALIPLIAMLAVLVVAVAAGVLHGRADPATKAAAEWIRFLATIAIGIVALWAGLAIGIQRLHDRDRSGWWVLIALLPIGGSIWYLLWNGLEPGTLGPNRFGPAPLSRYAAALAVFEDEPPLKAARRPIVSTIAAWLCLLTVVALNVLLFQTRRRGSTEAPCHRLCRSSAKKNGRNVTGPSWRTKTPVRNQKEKDLFCGPTSALREIRA